MRSHASRMEATEFHSWSGICLIATSSLRRECWWHLLCQHHWCIPAELSPEMEAALGVEAKPEPMSVTVRQEKLLEKLNLDGLVYRSLRNAAVAKELVLAYHNIFALESNELGCTSTIEHEICINNSKPFKEQFRCIPPSLLEEMHALLWDILDAGAVCPSQLPWCNTVVLVRKKDGILHFCVNFRHLNMWTRKDSYPLPCIQEALESMTGPPISHQWISSQASGK